MTAFLAAVQSSDPDSSAGTFYALAALSMLAMWAVLSAGCGFSDFYRRGTHCPLFTRPLCQEVFWEGLGITMCARVWRTS